MTRRYYGRWQFHNWLRDVGQDQYGTVGTRLIKRLLPTLATSTLYRMVELGKWDGYVYYEQEGDEHGTYYEVGLESLVRWLVKTKRLGMLDTTLHIPNLKVLVDKYTKS
jgi:hypothetical protein